MRVLVLLLCVVASCPPSDASGATPQYFYFSWTGDFSAPQPSLTAERTDNRLKWFDDRPDAKSIQQLEAGAYLPKDYTLVFRYRQIDGNHFGEAAKYQCILFFCSWISGSILSGLPSNDRVTYRIRSGEMWIEKPPFDALSGLRLRGGVNVVGAQLRVVGAGLESTESVVVPLPFLGAAYTQEMFWKLTFFAEADYSRFQNKRARVSFRDAAVGVSAKISDYVHIAAGVRNNLFDASYQKDSISATLTIPQTTPFVTLRISY